MKLGVLTAVYQDLPLEAALDRIQGLGLDAVEIGTGNYPGDAHCHPGELLADAAALKRFQKAIADRSLQVSALACHGNPLHPDAEVARSHHEVFTNTVQLAQRLGVDRVTLFSGCPGDGPGARRPNWVTCAWPVDYQAVLEWQWNQVVIPYWRDQAEFARSHRVRLCFEMHPGFVVYNPATLLRLREAVGEEVGANFDPSHLFWQGIDVLSAVRRLGPAIYHVHAKDTALNQDRIRVDGVLDTTPLDRVRDRAWLFRTVGHGHDMQLWKSLLSTLREAGYDGVVSIEHEDALAGKDEGLRAAVSFLRDCIFTDPPAEPWWTA